MNKHVFFTAMAYWFFGIGTTTQIIGLEAGLSLMKCEVIFLSSAILLLIVQLTSLEKLKSFIRKNETK